VVGFLVTESEDPAALLADAACDVGLVKVRNDGLVVSFGTGASTVFHCS
jgi:hypothetical protein